MIERQILIKPVSGRCNMHCRYCFYRDVEEHRREKTTFCMGREVVRSVVEKGLKAVDVCTFAFQGGEPTLAGLDFFQKFVDEVERKRKRDQKVCFTIQTNGIELNDKWIDFFREKGFLVGVSLDGVRKSHDSNRTDGGRRGTFERVFGSAVSLRDAGVPVNILCVLNRQTAERIEAVYRFFMRKGFYRQQYIPCLDPFGKECSKDFSLTSELHKEVLKKLFDLWFEDKIRGNPVYIRQFDNYVQILKGGIPEACTMYGKCTMQNVVEVDGSVYPCDFYALDEYCMGNILETDFETLRLESFKERKGSFFENSTVRDERCGKCRWYPLCRGGCKRDCMVVDGRWRNKNCEVYASFFEYTIERLEFLAALNR